MGRAIEQPYVIGSVPRLKDANVLGCCFEARALGKDSHSCSITQRRVEFDDAPSSYSQSTSGEVEDWP